MMRRCRSLAFVTAILLLSGAAPPRNEVDILIDRMSDDERIAQMLFVGFEGQMPGEELRDLAGTRHVGGIVLYSANIETPVQVKELTGFIQRSGGALPPFIAVDQEGGIVHRLRLGVPVIPSNMALGAAASPDLARRAGRAVGAGLRELGFTMNFAPVLDVLTEARNEGIETRSFSDRPELVAALGSAFIEGEHEAGVLAVGKHFPGQGGVAGDTHSRLPRSEISIATLRHRELVPFRAAFAHGLRAVMTTHVAFSRIAEKPDRAATLSRRILTTIARDELRFDGIIITDALQMKALTAGERPGTLAVEAIEAGADMVLALGGRKQEEEVFSALGEAVRSGRLSRDRLRRSLRRILRLKQTLPSARASVPPDAHIVDEVARRALTIVASNPLPRLPPISEILYVGPDGPLRDAFAGSVVIPLPSRLASEVAASRTAAAIAAARSAKLCIVVASNASQFDVVRDLAEHTATAVVFMNLGSPYRILSGEGRWTLLTYSDSIASQHAAIDVLFGRTRAEGSLPVNVSR